MVCSPPVQRVGARDSDRCPLAFDLVRHSLELLRTDEGAVLYRGRHEDEGNRLLLVLADEFPTADSLKRLEHELSLREELSAEWAARPLGVTRHLDRTVLVSEDAGGVPLDRLLGSRRDLGFALRVGAELAKAIHQLHLRGIIHKDIKPANVLVDDATGRCWLRGFGIASRLPRERQSLEPPEFIAGTLAYMAPEQTGRMNRSIDSRSDLYALGVTLYELMTGGLPFLTTDPMELVHCHIARRPVPPRERAAYIAAPVSDIVMKLLAKTAEDRYQTASGVESDLRRCLVEWQARGAVGPFELGENDIADRLLMPEKLYGREREIEALLASFARILDSGRPELTLVSGYSGIGKSSVVNELHKVLVSPRGLFASGKFDQYKRDIPYATLAQAFQHLIRPLLSKNEHELRAWRDALLAALGPNGRLMVDLVPELKLIIGEQPPVPELSPQDAQGRFQRVLRRFIAVFASKEHPLALFLDDLQWLDAATLDLLEDLLTRQDVPYLMLIGAYRDNEVGAAHPLTRKLDAIRQAGATVHEISLAPLARADMELLSADFLRTQASRVAPLAALIHEKTAGNPFFAIQFVHTLAEEGLIAFDHARGEWCWDLQRIHAKGFTDNVVELMVRKLTRLRSETQAALQELACLGSSAEVTTFSRARETSEEAAHADLWEAVRLELVLRSEGSYKFVHDRVQEASYSQIPEAFRARAHLRIGRLLKAHTPDEKREEAIFEIVNQLNRGISLISTRAEREELAELNLVAGKRAKAATAYASALKYLATGSALLLDAPGEPEHNLSFQLELNRAECEFLTGDLASAEVHLSLLSERARTPVEQANVACLRVDLYTTLNQSDRAVAVCLEYLRRLGVDWSAHPTAEEGRREFERIQQNLGERTIEELIELPLMTDATSLATMDVLTKVLPPALFTDAKLLSLAACWAVNLSLERGNCDGSCVAYVWLGMIAGPHFGNYHAGFRFGQLGHELIEKRGLKRFEARTYLWFAQFVVPWTKHVRSCRPLMRRAFAAANASGDLTIAAYACNNLNTNFLAAGDPLSEAQRESEQGREFASNARFGFVVDIIDGQLGLIRTLRGLTRLFGSFDDGVFEESSFERHLASEPSLALPECWYWTRKLQARYFAGDYRTALQAASRAEQLLWTSPSIFEPAEYHFYAALTRAALCEPGGGDPTHVEALLAHHRQLELWASNCPENFETRAALVGAELARIRKDELLAERSYEQAIRAARTNGFVHNEALASELAARFHRERGFETIANAYLREARYGYQRWGADGKLRQLDEAHPRLQIEELGRDPTRTIGASVEQLDLATVIRVSQAISSEMVIEKLIDALMRTALEHAGAERGLLLASHGSENGEDQRIEAEASTQGDRIVVEVREARAHGAAFPDSVVQFVMRTQSSVILDDACASGPFVEDVYVRERRARSLLCLPLVNPGKLSGVLYLENNLTPGAFTPSRIAVLKLLASQAAISLENTRLYRDLERREGKIRRLVDANIMGVFIWDVEGHIFDANDAFLHMVGYDRAELEAGCLRWNELTAAEWRDRDVRALADVDAKGAALPYEKEFVRKDGGRVPVMIGAAIFEDSQRQGVAFVLDLTEQRRAQEALRQREAELAETRADLAHVTRVAALGELTASIAHEINQPLTAVVNNANASLRWLSWDPPRLDEARNAIKRTLRDGSRAGEVISRMRLLFKKSGAVRQELDLNEAIAEIIVLAKNEAQRKRVSVHTELAAGLPAIHGDRVQLQQVILNLLINSMEALGMVSEGMRELWVSSEPARIDPDGSPSSGEPASAATEAVSVTVRDSGPGLSPTALERAFDAFYTTKVQGIGMGLAISRSIVEAHGGRLWVEANTPAGATFRFIVPVESRPVSGG
jgi:PAS domain S-box-containing protein